MTLAKINILLIEDNESDAFLVQDDLRMAMGDQISVIHTERVNTAFELLQSQSFDLILSDLTLPDSDGITTINLLREKAANIPIAVLSFRDDEKLAIKALQAGAQDYLVKGNLTEGTLSRVIRYSIERKRIEQNVQQAQQRFQTIFEKAPLGIALINLQTGKYYDINPRYAAIVNRSIDELMHISQADIIHPDDLPSYQKEITYFLKHQQADYKLEKRIIQSNVGVIWIEMFIVPFETLNHEEICYLCMIEDISERKQLIENLQHLTTHLQEVREEERTRIGREIHDVLGATLTVLKMDLDWLSKKISDNPMHERIKSLYQLTGEAIETARRVAINLRPNVLDNIGLFGAIEWLIRDFEQRTNIKCTVELMIPSLIFHNKSHETGIFRIVQEAFINIARHAQATQVDVKLMEDADFISISIKDNGIGIDDAQMHHPESFGIISMHERTKQFGGKLVISGTPMQGTLVALKIPLTITASEVGDFIND